MVNRPSSFLRGPLPLPSQHIRLSKGSVMGRGLTGPGVVVAHNHLRPGELARLVSVHVQRGSSLRAVGVCECIQSRALPLHFNNAVMMRLSLTGLWFASIPFCGVFAILTQGLYTDFVKDGDKEKSCVLLPLRPPQGMTTSWNSQYR